MLFNHSVIRQPSLNPSKDLFTLLHALKLTHHHYVHVPMALIALSSSPYNELFATCDYLSNVECNLSLLSCFQIVLAIHLQALPCADLFRLQHQDLPGLGLGRSIMLQQHLMRLQSLQRRCSVMHCSTAVLRASATARPARFEKFIAGEREGLSRFPGPGAVSNIAYQSGEVAVPAGGEREEQQTADNRQRQQTVDNRQQTADRRLQLLLRWERGTKQIRCFTLLLAV